MTELLGDRRIIFDRAKYATTASESKNIFSFWATTTHNKTAFNVVLEPIGPISVLGAY